MMSKYKAKPFYLDLYRNEIVSVNDAKQSVKEVKERLIYFASKHEYRVYRQLQKLSGNYTIQLQPKIELIPPNTISCYPKGKYWKADFLVSGFEKDVMLVEAKGTLTRDFPLILALLELNNKELFDKLWLVFPTRIPQSLVIKRLLNTSMKDRIIKLAEMNQQLKVMNTL